VQKHGTHPTEVVTDPQTGRQRDCKLTDQEKESFKVELQGRLTTAERNLREAERNRSNKRHLHAVERPGYGTIFVDEFAFK
jgi:hypothetical protein